jgi:hypothetical protein
MVGRPLAPPCFFRLDHEADEGTELGRFIQSPH